MELRRPRLWILAPVLLLLFTVFGCTTPPSPSTTTSLSALSTTTTEPTVTTVHVPRVMAYNDLAAFEAAAPGELMLVDFDTDADGVPIIADSPGVRADGYYKFHGIVFEAGVIFGEPNLPFLGVSAPNTITDSGVNTPMPALVYGVFVGGSAVYQVGITNIGAEAELRIYDDGGMLLGSARSDADMETKDFVGLISNTPIRHMEYDFAGGLGFEGDDLLFTKITP